MIINDILIEKQNEKERKLQTMDNVTYKQLKENYYNFILNEPLQGLEDKNIQYIIEVNGTYGIASMKPLTVADLQSIDFDKWQFRPYSEIKEEWSNG